MYTDIGAKGRMKFLNIGKDIGLMVNPVEHPILKKPTGQYIRNYVYSHLRLFESPINDIDDILGAIVEQFDTENILIFKL